MLASGLFDIRGFSLLFAGKSAKKVSPFAYTYVETKFF